jgi:hypothetical protein
VVAVKPVAALVVLAWLGVSAWAWRRAPGRQMADQFVGVWRLPWGRQFYVDFFGLQIVLALWMLSEAATRGTWILGIACVAAMPVFGALPAALYWLVSGF